MYLPLLEQFRNYLSSKGVSKITAKNYLSDIRKFLTWFETQFSRLFVATDLTVDVIELFEKTKGATIQNKNDTEYEILNTEYSSRSLERYLSALRKFAKFLVEEKLIDADPFEILNTKYEILNTKQDPWHLKEFRDYLYVYGAAKLTIKNYTVDILAFTKWIEITVLASRGEALQGQGISLINQELIEDYKERLTSVLELSPKSVNRKLSSIRKYLQFAVAQNLIKDLPFVASQGETLRGLRAQTGLNLDDLKETEDNQQPIINNQYSKFPPLRLLQKMFVPYELLEDRLSSKIARAIRNFRLANRVSKFAFRRTTNDKRRTFPIGNIPKVAYAPQQISLANKAWHKKLFHHARYTRPNWYKRYHSYAFTHYFHFAILVIYASLIGFLIYTALFSETQDKQALAAPVAPPRILSFQGRLTDQNDNPITTATDLRFQVYDDSSTTGSGNLLWQEVIEVSPDQDGIFSELLGNGSTCTGQPLTVQQTRCAIPSSVFTDNSALYLGISVENTAELTPRQRLATVAYAANSESLQGMLPITDAAVTDNVNTILALDSSGNLTMDGATAPTFQATGGQFKISGQPLLLTTNTGTSNNVIIDPDGIGKVDVRKPLANTTATGNISPGGVEVDDKFGVLATESAVAAFVVNNNTTGGDIFTASSSGTTRFTLSNAGVASFVGGQTADITSLGNANLTVSAGGTGDLRLLSDSDTDILLPYSDFTSTNSVLYSAETTGKLSRATTVSSNLCLVSGASAPSWSSCGAAAGDDWDVTNGAIYPKLASTLDLLIGGTTTASAKFAFINVNSGNPTATISGNLALAVPTTAGANTLDLFNNSTLNIRTSVGGDAGATTALFIDKRGNSGRVGIGTTGPDAPLDVLSTGGTQLRLTYADGSTYTDINTDTNGDLTIAPSGGDTNITGTLDVSGHGAFGGGASVSTIYILNAQENITAGAGSTYYGGFFAPVFTTTAGAQTQPSYGAYFSAGLGAGNNQDWTNSVMGLNSVRASLSITAGATGTITHAADFLARSDGLGAATITNYYGLRVDNPAGAGTVTNTYGIYVQNLTKGATADYGIYVAGADTYALWVDTGTSRFDGLIDAQGGVTVASGQNLTLAGITGNNAVLYGTTGTGVVTSATTSTSGQCLLSGAAAGYTPSWTTCPGGVDTTDVFWGQSSGLLYPNNSTVDLSIGGQSTASAKFAFINVNSGNPTATISGNLALAVPTTAGANTLDLLNNSTLNIRTSVGGDAGATTALFIDKRGNSGNIGISDTTPDASLEVVNDGSGDSFLVADTNDGDTTPFVIQSDGDVGIGTANPQVKLDIVGGAGGAVSRDVLREVISGEAGIHISRRGLNAYGISFGQSLTDALDTTTVPPWAIIFEGDALNIRRGAANQAVHAVNPLVSITSAGNVGIGTTAPDARLEINHATGDSLRLTYNDSDGSAANYTDLELASDGSLTLTSTGADVTFVSDFNTGVNIGASTNTPAPLSISGGIGSNAAFVVDQLNSGDIIAASASGTTKFTLSNAGVLTLVGGQTPDITTQTNATFTITPNGTGNLILGSDFDSGTTIGTAITGEFPLLIRSGIGSNAALVIDQLNSADIFSASASGVTKFTISNSGDVTFAGGDITGANGAAIDIGEATSGDIEITGDLLPASDATYDLGSTTKSWQNIYLTGNLCFDDTDCMSTSTTGYWDQTNGALYPKISTVDLLIGGTSTASAKFAVLNMSGTGTPVASVSSGLSGTSAYLTADGTLATQNRMALTIGNSSTYNTTGNVLINPNGTGNVGIGTTGPGYLLDVNGLAHAATALVVGTNPATGGSLRLPTDTGVNVRNEANTLNIQLIGLSSGNVLRIGGGGDVAPAGVNVNTGTVGLYPESDNDSLDKNSSS